MLLVIMYTRAKVHSNVLGSRQYNKCYGADTVVQIKLKQNIKCAKVLVH